MERKNKRIMTNIIIMGRTDYIYKVGQYKIIMPYKDPEKRRAYDKQRRRVERAKKKAEAKK